MSQFCSARSKPQPPFNALWVLCHAAYPSIYLDDVIITSGIWPAYVQWVATVLESLRLTANPKKSAVGRPDLQCQEYHLRSGQIHPQIEITAAFTFCLHPKTKKEVRRLLGLAGYYRWFMPDLVDQPLTDLVRWTEQWQAGFVQVKKALYGERLLHSPNVSLPFILPTDASNKGLGAVQCKRSAWPCNGQSTIFVIASWVTLLPSVRIPAEFTPSHEECQYLDQPVISGSPVF